MVAHAKVKEDVRATPRSSGRERLQTIGGPTHGPDHLPRMAGVIWSVLIGSALWVSLWLLWRLVF